MSTCSRALIDESRLTRAELAARTGISKPTVGESVRRLEAAGVVVDTGARTTGRGRAGSYYALANGIGCALAVSIAPEGITAEIVDAHGDVVARASSRPPSGPVAAVAASVRRAGRRASALAHARSGWPWSVPPTRSIGHRPARFVARRSVRCRRAVTRQDLADLVAGPVLVDNDVNWAARAERLVAESGSMDDFVYLYLGEGLGCAVVSDGEVRRGHGGIAGEIAHLVTAGPGGRAMAIHRRVR